MRIRCICQHALALSCQTLSEIGRALRPPPQCPACPAFGANVLYQFDVLRAGTGAQNYERTPRNSTSPARQLAMSDAVEQAHRVLMQTTAGAIRKRKRRIPGRCMPLWASALAAAASMACTGLL
jgi:hypothetical protein